jgi:hypothetical protein
VDIDWQRQPDLTTLCANGSPRRRHIVSRSHITLVWFARCCFRVSHQVAAGRARAPLLAHRDGAELGHSRSLFAQPAAVSAPGSLSCWEQSRHELLPVAWERS